MEKCNLCLQLNTEVSNQSGDHTKSLIERHFSEILELIIPSPSHPLLICHDCSQHLIDYENFHHKITAIHNEVRKYEIIEVKEEDPEDIPSEIIQIQKQHEDEDEIKEFEDEIINYSPLEEIKLEKDPSYIPQRPHPKIKPEDDRRIRETANMKCTRCSVKFDTFWHAMSHYRTIHKQLGFVMCCGIKFKIRAFLVRHVHTHYKSAFPCTMCSKSFQSAMALNGHMIKHQENDEMSQYDTDYDYLTKVCFCGSKVNDSEFCHCMDCHRNFPKPNGGFMKHIKKGCKPFGCVKCSRLFSKKCNVKVHFEICKEEANFKPGGNVPEVKAPENLNNFAYNENQHHDDKETNSVVITKCSCGFALKNSQVLHCMDCHKNFSKGNGKFTDHMIKFDCKPYACGKCSKLFRKKCNAKVHFDTCKKGRKIKHAENLLFPETKTPKEVKPFIYSNVVSEDLCDTDYDSVKITHCSCGNKVTDPELLHCMDCHRDFAKGNGKFTKHMDKSNCRPYACVKCSKLFRKKCNARSHFQCCKIGEKLKINFKVEQTELKNSIKNKNQNGREYDILTTSCHCGSVVNDSSFLHCMDCHKDFTKNTGGFMRHIFKKGCKPYGCVKCSKLFRKKSNARTHFQHCKKNQAKFAVNVKKEKEEVEAAESEHEDEQTIKAEQILGD